MFNQFSKAAQTSKNKDHPEKETKKKYWGKKPKKVLSESKASQLYKNQETKESTTVKKVKNVPPSKLTQVSKNKSTNLKKTEKRSIDTSVLPNGKEAQLKKEEKDNPRKMNKIEYNDKCDWIFSTFPACEICKENQADQIHHSIYGYKQRDDRSIMGVCEECHYQVHHGTKGIKKSRGELEERGLKIHALWEKEKINRKSLIGTEL